MSPQAHSLQPVAGAPRLSAAGGRLLRELDVVDESGARRTLQVPIERPLTIIINGQELVTLMTLGAKPELLVLGYLRNQRMIGRVTEIESISVDLSAGSAVVLLRPAGAGAGAMGAISAIAVQKPGTACGLGSVFGDWMMRDDACVPPQLGTAHIGTAPAGTAPVGTAPVGTAPVGTAPVGTAQLSRSTLLRILEITREYDAVHRAAGSVHGCALFHGAELLVSIEDVSRHNGLDIVTGWMLLHGVEGLDKTLFTTGRLTGEMVMKAAHNGVSIMVSRNGVTSMGCELAVKLGMLLFGRAAKSRYLCYTGFERFDGDR
jgi:FdhD protein